MGRNWEKHLLPDLGLLFGFGRCYDTGLLGTFVPVFGLGGRWLVPMKLGGAGETFRTHNAWDVPLPSLTGFGNGLRNDSVGLLLLVLQSGRLHLLLPLRHPFLWRRRVRGRRRGGAALHRRAEQPDLTTRTISVLRRLEKWRRDWSALSWLLDQNHMKHIFSMNHQIFLRCESCILRLIQCWEGNTSWRFV